MLSLAFEPVAVAWVIPVAVAGFVARRPAGCGCAAAFVVGLVFGAAFYFTHICWMRAVGIPAWIALSTLETLFYGLLGSLSALLQRHRLWPLWFAAAWTAVEVWRSGWPLGGMPWGRLAFGVVDTPVAEALPYAGAVGVSFLLALLGALLAWLVTGPVAGEGSRRVAALAPGRPGGAARRTRAACPWQAEADGELTVAAVQGDVPGNGDDILYDYRQVTQNHVDATVDLARQVEDGEVPRPDFVALAGELHRRRPVRRRRDQRRDPGGELGDRGADPGRRDRRRRPRPGPQPGHRLGPGDRRRGPLHQAAPGAVRRVHPAAARSSPSYNFFDRLREVGRDMLSGTRDEPLDIGGVQVADAICFDIAYDDGLTAQLRNGAELLVVQSSNATFIHTDQIDQQFAITRLRAIETGRWVAVATTNGVSGVIAPDGAGRRHRRHRAPARCWSSRSG